MAYFYTAGEIWGTSDAATVKKWSAKLHKEGNADFFFSKFMGEGEEKIVQVNHDLSKGPGDAVTFNLMNEFTGAGQESATGIILAGNEEIASTESFQLELLEAGHSTRVKSKLDLKRPAFDVKLELGARLKMWIRNKIENKLIVNGSTLLTSPSDDRYIDITEDSNALFTPAVVDRAYRLAPTTTPYIRPVNVKGKEVFVVLASPWQIKSFKEDETYQAFGQNAMPKVIAENPFLGGADIYWNNCCIFDYNRVVLSSGLIARALFLGQQSLAIAYGQEWSWMEDLADVPRRLPVLGTDALWNADKVVYDDKEYGMIVIDTLYEEDD